MGVLYRWLIRPFFRFQDSEKAHHRSLLLLRLTTALPLGGTLLKMLYRPRHSVPITVFGQTYNNPFGLAAGMDKNALALRGWETHWFGFYRNWWRHTTRTRRESKAKDVSCESSPSACQQNGFQQRRFPKYTPSP